MLYLHEDRWDMSVDAEPCCDCGESIRINQRTPRITDGSCIVRRQNLEKGCGVGLLLQIRRLPLVEVTK